MAHASVVDRQGRELSSHPVGAGSLEPRLVESDPRWQLALRVVASRHFVRSALLSRFLLYIVAESLEGRAETITEHAIGVRVFDRPASYRTVEDNIVRNYARQLRRRLADYFGEEGAAEPLQIDIPLGGYVPAFVIASSESDAEPPARKGPVSIRPEASSLHAEAAPVVALTEAAPHRESPAASGFVRAALFLLYSLALIGAAWFAGTFAATHFHASRAVAGAAASDASPTAPLWASLFGGSVNTYIVPSDAGLNLLEDLSRRPITLADYISGGASRLALPAMDAHSEQDLRGQHFTSFVDLEILAALARLPQYNPERAVLRFPRDLRLDDIRNSNGVILGSISSNPWAAMAEGNANFRIVIGPGMQGAVIVNAHPASGEAPTYISHWNEPDHETFALLTFLPNLSGNGRLLLLQGLDVAGTQAAAEALLHPTAIAPILKQATRPDGTLRSFEILLRTTSLQGASTRTTVVGSRIE